MNSELRRELALAERHLKFFTSEHRKYRGKSDLAEPYRVMRKGALSWVRRLKSHIRKIEDAEAKRDQLAARRADARHHQAD
jgi:hypothetical protein